MKIMPRVFRAGEHRNRITRPLLPVPVAAFPEWNRRVRDWMQA
jgi:hypothetical protein